MEISKEHQKFAEKYIFIVRFLTYFYSFWLNNSCVVKKLGFWLALWTILNQFIVVSISKPWKTNSSYTIQSFKFVFVEKY